MPSSASRGRKIITDKLVLEKTGRTITDWFDELDKKGAKGLDHAAIFDLVAAIDGLKPLGQWNQNLLTTSYEWDRGLKERGSRPDGTIEIGVSKTVAVPVEVLYAALIDDDIRAKWLPGQMITFRKTTPNRSARATWSDGVPLTSKDVVFTFEGQMKNDMLPYHAQFDQYVQGVQAVDHGLPGVPGRRGQVGGGEILDVVPASPQRGRCWAVPSSRPTRRPVRRR